MTVEELIQALSLFDGTLPIALYNPEYGMNFSLDTVSLKKALKESPDFEDGQPVVELQ
jgi:hypothetical protein